MNEALSLAHHNLYEYATTLLQLAEERNDDENSIKVDKNSVLQLAAAYQHLYSDVYINQRIRPLKVLLHENDIH